MRKVRTARQRRRVQFRKWPRWKYRQYLRSKDWKKQRRKKFRQVGRRCEKCGSRKKIHVHHRTYDRLGCERMSDLQVLCSMCHLDVHLAEAFGVRPEAFDELAWRI